MHWYDIGGHMGFMGGWWIVGLILLVALVLVLVRAGSSGNAGARLNESAEDLLKRRYAAGGELSLDEYDLQCRPSGRVPCTPRWSRTAPALVPSAAWRWSRSWRDRERRTGQSWST